MRRYPTNIGIVLASSLGIVLVSSLVTTGVIISTFASPPTQSVTFTGNINQLICPEDILLPIESRTLTISALKQDGVVTGTFSVAITSVEDPPVPFPPQKSGTITAGAISENRFTLHGTENTDFLCGASVPSPVTITGECGPGSDSVSVRVANGERIRAIGTASCTTTG